MNIKLDDVCHLHVFGGQKLDVSGHDFCLCVVYLDLVIKTMLIRSRGGGKK